MKIFDKMSDIALKLMFYGTKTSFGILIIGILAYRYNILVLGNRYTNTVFCLTIIQAAYSLFVQFIIGGLIFDCVYSKK